MAKRKIEQKIELEKLRIKEKNLAFIKNFTCSTEDEFKRFYSEHKNEFALLKQIKKRIKEIELNLMSEAELDRNQDYIQKLKDKFISDSSSSIRKVTFKKGITCFNNILKKYAMELKFDESYEYEAAKIFNDNCIIDISMDRYYPDLNIYFINPKSNQEYSYGMVMNQREVYEKEAKSQIKTENHNIETKLKDISELMEKYCSDILSGDFSTLEINA